MRPGRIDDDGRVVGAQRVAGHLRSGPGEHPAAVLARDGGERVGRGARDRARGPTPARRACRGTGRTPGGRRGRCRRRPRVRARRRGRCWRRRRPAPRTGRGRPAACAWRDGTRVHERRRRTGAALSSSARARTSRDPSPEERPLRAVRRQRQGPLVGGRRLAPATEPPQEVRAGRRGRTGTPPSRGRRPARRRRPARPPARRPAASATARLRSTTGDGATRRSTSYRPRICAQSVSAAVGASSWTAAIAAWSWYGPTRPIRSARSTSARPSAIRAASQRDRSWSSRRTSSPRGPSRAGRRASVSSIRASRPGRLRLAGEQRREDAAQPDRLGAQLAADQRLAGGGVVALVEHEVQDPEHGVQPVGQAVPGRHLVRDARPRGSSAWRGPAAGRGSAPGPGTRGRSPAS